MIMTGKCFELSQDVEATMTARLKTLMKKTCRAASESRKSDETSLFNVRGRVLRRINGSRIIFKHLNIHHVFTSLTQQR